MTKAGQKPGVREEVKLITKNRKAYFNYLVEEDLEVGIVLRGTEVKALREGKVQILDAYAMVEKGQVFLYQLHISEYAQGNIYNHSPMATRKLLLHKREIERLEWKVQEKGYTLIPLELYFLRGRAKIKLGLCKGKHSYDKREAVKERDQRRELRERDT